MFRNEQFGSRLHTSFLIENLDYIFCDYLLSTEVVLKIINYKKQTLYNLRLQNNKTFYSTKQVLRYCSFINHQIFGS